MQWLLGLDATGGRRSRRAWAKEAWVRSTYIHWPKYSSSSLFGRRQSGWVPSPCCLGRQRCCQVCLARSHLTLLLLQPPPLPAGSRSSLLEAVLLEPSAVVLPAECHSSSSRRRRFHRVDRAVAMASETDKTAAWAADGVNGVAALLIS